MTSNIRACQESNNRKLTNRQFHSFHGRQNLHHELHQQLSPGHTANTTSTDFDYDNDDDCCRCYYYYYFFYYYWYC